MSTDFKVPFAWGMLFGFILGAGAQQLISSAHGEDIRPHNYTQFDSEPYLKEIREQPPLFPYTSNSLSNRVDDLEDEVDSLQTKLRNLEQDNDQEDEENEEDN